MNAIANSAEVQVFSLQDWHAVEAALSQRVKDVSQRISDRVRNVMGDESRAIGGEQLRDRVAYMLWVAAARG